MLEIFQYTNIHAIGNECDAPPTSIWLRWLWLTYSYSCSCSSVRWNTIQTRRSTHYTGAHTVYNIGSRTLRVSFPFYIIHIFILGSSFVCLLTKINYPTDMRVLKNPCSQTHSILLFIYSFFLWLMLNFHFQRTHQFI